MMKGRALLRVWLTLDRIAEQRRSCPAGLIRAGRNAPNAALSTSTLRPFAVTVFAPCAHGNPRGGSSIVPWRQFKLWNWSIRINICTVVLTLQHAKGDCLRDHLNVLTRAYGRFRRFSAMKSVDGSLRSIEITRGEHGFHPHIHAILTVPRAAAHITEDAVRDAWRRALDSEYTPQVDLTEAYSADAEGDVFSAVAEACKYALKPGMLPEVDDADLREFIEAVRGVRMVSSDGDLKRCLQVAAMQPPQQSDKCPECGAHRWQRHVALIYDYETGSLNEGAPL